MHHFKAFDMINLQYEIKVWKKILNKATNDKNQHPPPLFSTLRLFLYSLREAQESIQLKTARKSCSARRNARDDTLPKILHLFLGITRFPLMHILAYVRASLEFFVLVESSEYVAPLPQVLHFSRNQMCTGALIFD